MYTYSHARVLLCDVINFIIVRTFCVGDLYRVCVGVFGHMISTSDSKVVRCRKEVMPESEPLLNAPNFDYKASSTELDKSKASIIQRAGGKGGGARN